MSSLPANRGMTVKYKRSAFALNMFRKKASFILVSFNTPVLLSVALKPKITSFIPRKNRKAIPKTLMKVSKYKLLTIKLEKPNPTNNPCNKIPHAVPIITFKGKRSNYDVFKRLLTAAIISPAITQETKNGSTNKTLFPS